MNNYFVDLHIHIGADNKGQPVKITASKKLNFENIAKEALQKKGLDMIGIIDCGSPRVINDIENLIKNNEMRELSGGGILYKDELVIIPGMEVESREKNGGQAHYLIYFPTLKQIKNFSQIMEQYISNINLSSQASGLTGKEILKIAVYEGGILIPAHAFTPHKSFYGNCFKTYREVFSKEEWEKIPAIELGLSADSNLADYLSELEHKTFLSNSDAHSFPKIAREYNIFKMKKLNFEEFKMVLNRQNGRKVIHNYGLDPRLGKYHRSYCPDCEKSFAQEEKILKCPDCGNDKIIVGVKDRVLDIKDRIKSNSPLHRPKYTYQVPLLDLPGIGKSRLNKLLNEFSNEMNILHNISKAALSKVIGSRLAELIVKARKGELQIESGGGGNYGQVEN